MTLSPLSHELLPYEPRVADAPRQQALTERFLLPALPALDALFTHLRNGVETATLASGDSHALTLAVSKGLGVLEPNTLAAPAAAGHAALAAFLAAGGTMRRVWGVLRGERFHDAFLFGSLCIDVAHAQRGVDIVPFQRAGLTPVRDHRHYALLATHSRNAHVLPNHVLPALAPYLPLLVLVPGGSVSLAANESYMLALAHAGGFTSSARVLGQEALDDNLFQLIAAKLNEGGIATPANAVQGRAAALEACGRYRDGRRRAGDAQEQKALALLAQANERLRELSVS